MGWHRERAHQGLLLAALCVAAYVRFRGLGDESLWLDELFSVRAASRESWAGLIEEVRQDVHPPLYFALLRVWMAVFGDSDAAVRVPSALAGLGAVVGTFALGRKLWGEREGLAGAWLLALAPFAVALDREARGNALLSALSVWSTLLATGSSRRSRVAYAVVTGAMLWTHAFGLAVLAAHGLWVGLDALAGDRQRLRSWLPGAAGALLIYLPWVGIFLSQTRVFVDKPWYTEPAADSLGWLLPTLGGGAGLTVLLVVGVTCLYARREAASPSRLLPAMFLGLILLPHAASLVAAPILRDRNVLPLVPALVSAAAAGFVATGSGPALVLLSGGAGALVIGRTQHEQHNEQWREAAAAVHAGWLAGDRVDANHLNLWRHYLPEVGDEPKEVGRTWVLRAHEDLDGPFPTDLGELLEERWFRGVRLRLHDPHVHALRFETAGAPMWVDDTLHFYWNTTIRNETDLLKGTCQIGIVGSADIADGLGAQLRVRLIERETAVVEWSLSLGGEATTWWSPNSPVDGAVVEIGFENDGTGVGPDGKTADRNAHLTHVWTRCR